MLIIVHANKPWWSFEVMRNMKILCSDDEHKDNHAIDDNRIKGWYEAMLKLTFNWSDDEDDKHMKWWWTYEHEGFVKWWELF